MGSYYDNNDNHIVDKSQLVTGLKLSSVVPASPTEDGKARPLTGLDMAVKLHYLRGVYFFDHEVMSGLTIVDLKLPLFYWLDHYNVVCGRIRVPEDEAAAPGTHILPFIKMNDAGVRLVEAECMVTVEEWLAMPDCCALSDELLVYNSALGPDLPFSPLVFLQITQFKCGGISMGLRWAHVLGDGFSAASFMSSLGRFQRSSSPQLQPKPLRFPDLSKPVSVKTDNQPVYLKRVRPVGTHWIAPTADDASSINGSQITSHTFHLTPTHIDRLRSAIPDPVEKSAKIQPFELIAAAIWRSVAKIRKNTEDKPNVVTVIRHRSPDRTSLVPFNGCAVSSAAAPSDSDLADLAAAIASAEEETSAVGKFVEKEVGEGGEGGSDFVMYGANLTFVDLEGADLYGFEFYGKKKPVFANYTVGGVGGGGVVLVLPAAPGNGDERVVTVMLPEYEVEGLKYELI